MMSYRASEWFKFWFVFIVFAIGCKELLVLILAFLGLLWTLDAVQKYIKENDNDRRK